MTSSLNSIANSEPFSSKAFQNRSKCEKCLLNAILQVVFYLIPFSLLTVVQNLNQNKLLSQGSRHPTISFCFDFVVIESTLVSSGFDNKIRVSRCKCMLEIGEKSLFSGIAFGPHNQALKVLVVSARVMDISG